MAKKFMVDKLNHNCNNLKGKTTENYKSNYLSMPQSQLVKETPWVPLFTKINFNPSVDR